MSYMKSMAPSASGKRSKLCGNRKIGPELPDVPETHAKVFTRDQKPKAESTKPTLRKSLGRSLKKWWQAWCKDFQNDEKILRREEHQRGLEYFGVSCSLHFSLYVDTELMMHATRKTDFGRSSSSSAVVQQSFRIQFADRESVRAEYRLRTYRVSTVKEYSNSSHSARRRSPAKT